MADDDLYDAYYNDDEYGYDDEASFEGYASTTVDTGVWTLVGTCAFCLSFILLLSCFLARTKQRRKRIEAQRNAAMARLGEAGKPTDADGKSVGTASTDEGSTDSESSSIITDVEDDSDSVTSTTVPIIDSVYSCGNEGSFVALKPLRRRFTRLIRSGAELLYEIFQCKSSPDRLFRERYPGFIDYNELCGVVLLEAQPDDDSSIGFEAQHDEEFSGYQRMRDEAFSGCQRMMEMMEIPLSTEAHADSEYHQMEEEGCITGVEHELENDAISDYAQMKGNIIRGDSRPEANGNCSGLQSDKRNIAEQSLPDPQKKHKKTTKRWLINVLGLRPHKKEALGLRATKKEALGLRPHKKEALGLRATKNEALGHRPKKKEVLRAKKKEALGLRPKKKEVLGLRPKKKEALVLRPKKKEALDLRRTKEEALGLGPKKKANQRESHEVSAIRRHLEETSKPSLVESTARLPSKEVPSPRGSNLDESSMTSREHKSSKTSFMDVECRSNKAKSHLEGQANDDMQLSAEIDDFHGQGKEAAKGDAFLIDVSVSAKIDDFHGQGKEAAEGGALIIDVSVSANIDDFNGQGKEAASGDASTITDSASVAESQNKSTVFYCKDEECQDEKTQLCREALADEKFTAESDEVHGINSSKVESSREVQANDDKKRAVDTNTRGVNAEGVPTSDVFNLDAPASSSSSESKSSTSICHNFECKKNQAEDSSREAQKSEKQLAADTNDHETQRRVLATTRVSSNSGASVSSSTSGSKSSKSSCKDEERKPEQAESHRAVQPSEQLPAEAKIEEIPRKKTRCRHIKSLCRKTRRVAQYDNEMRKILKLAIPYTTTCMFECLFSILTVAVVGTLLGTQQLSAYVAVDFALSLTTLWLGGPLESLTTLCSQAIGADENKLAGEYLQIAVVISQILFIPQLVFWLFYIDDLIVWLGFDEETAEIGYSYAVVLLFHELFTFVNEGLHNFLEVCDCEEFSAILSISQSAVSFTVTLYFALTSNMSLQMIGIIEFATEAAFFVVALLCIQCRGWFREYWPGILGTFALTNTKAVKQLIYTSIPLTFAHALSDGEWEVMLILATVLGPAEVVAFGLIGQLWNDIDAIIAAVGDAAEVRCSYLLGAYKPMRAKQSAQKSVLIAVTEGVFMAAFLASSGSYLPAWLTTDETLQGMLRDLLPLMSIGVLLDSVGSVSFAVVGAQGCFGLATSIIFIGSWLVTIPLAVLSTKFSLDLQCLAAAVVVGNTVSGMLNTFLMLDSDWYFFAERTQQRNKFEQSVDDGEEMV